MRLTRNALAVGITALSLAAVPASEGPPAPLSRTPLRAAPPPGAPPAVPASPAFAKGGGDAVGDAGSAGVVTFIAPDLVVPTNVKPNNSGKDRCKAWVAVGVD